MKNADILNKRESNEKQRRARKDKGERVIVKERKTGQKRVIDGDEYQKRRKKEQRGTERHRYRYRKACRYRKELDRN